MLKLVLVAVLLAVVAVLVVRRRARPFKRAGVLVGLTDAAAAGIREDLVARASGHGWEVAGDGACEGRVRDPELQARGSRVVSCDTVVTGDVPRAFTATSWRGRVRHVAGFSTAWRVHDLTVPLAAGAGAPRFCAAPLSATRRPRLLLPEQFWGTGHVGEGLIAWGVDLDPPTMGWIAGLAGPLAAAGCWVACLGDRVVLVGEGEPTPEVLQRRISLGASVADALERPLAAGGAQ
ncbi:hypothetical protein [Nocardioides sambongensis]|uniref:hypothetical protein n=1 Tax=Nocardioides sambongensis TaxID=2589074 RepID=UPI001125D5E5|nr:hypothetical protein [Nocardioides sambongensis]